ncbi:uncharacterized protein [Paramormyrops kingsleyae]|uniref:uncharacterized protein n=1 Tax=Paramormyrops kingsleyae TaxID=1676925 RepID=UPI003B97BEBC
MSVPVRLPPNKPRFPDDLAALACFPSRLPDDRDRMTSLSNNATQQGEDLWLVLLHEVAFWGEQPEIKEDPTLFGLVQRSQELLQGVNPRTEERNMAEVRSLLKQLVRRVREKRLQPLVSTEVTPPPPTGPGRKKKKRRRGKGEEAAPTLFLGACSLHPAWEDTAAIRLASFHVEKPPLLEAYFYRPEHLGLGGIRAVRDGIPRVPRALKGAALSRSAPLLPPVPDPPAAAAAALPAAPPVAAAAAALPAAPPVAADAAALPAAPPAAAATLPAALLDPPVLPAAAAAALPAAPPAAASAALPADPPVLPDPLVPPDPPVLPALPAVPAAATTLAAAPAAAPPAGRVMAAPPAGRVMAAPPAGQVTAVPAEAPLAGHVTAAPVLPAPELPVSPVLPALDLPVSPVLPALDLPVSPVLPALELPVSPVLPAPELPEVAAVAPPVGRVMAAPAVALPAGRVLAAPTEAPPADRTPEAPVQAAPAGRTPAAASALPEVPTEAPPAGYTPAAPSEAASPVMPAALPEAASPVMPAALPEAASPVLPAALTPSPLPRQGRRPPGPRLSVSSKGRGHRRRALGPASGSLSVASGPPCSGWALDAAFAGSGCASACRGFPLLPAFTGVPSCSLRVPSVTPSSRSLGPWVVPSCSLLPLPCSPSGRCPSPAWVPSCSPCSSSLSLSASCLCSSALCVSSVHSWPLRVACGCSLRVALFCLSVRFPCSLSGSVLRLVPVPVLCLCLVPCFWLMFCFVFQVLFPGSVSSVASSWARPVCAPLGGGYVTPRSVRSRCMPRPPRYLVFSPKCDCLCPVKSSLSWVFSPRLSQSSPDLSLYCPSMSVPVRLPPNKPRFPDDLAALACFPSRLPDDRDRASAKMAAMSSEGMGVPCVSPLLVTGVPPGDLSTGHSLMCGSSARTSTMLGPLVGPAPLP